jgi:excisionase family DNA binding protein
MQSYLTPEETAQQLKVGATEIMELIEQGKLRAISIGSNIRIPESEWADSCGLRRNGDPAG